MAEQSATDRSRRRFTRRQWLRRWLAWRAVLAVVLVVGAVGFVVYALYFSPWLRLESAEVTGTSQLSETDVLNAAALPTEDQLVLVDLSAIEARIEGRLTAVKSVEITREWPRAVRIEVEEWQPLAIVSEGSSYSFLAESGDTFTYVKWTDDGAVVPFVPAQPPGGLPEVRVGSEADRLALQEAAAVVASLDEAVARRVDHLEVETADRILLQLREGQVVTWGSAEQSEQKAEVLLDLLDARPDARSYDVSVPSLPATR